MSCKISLTDIWWSKPQHGVRFKTFSLGPRFLLSQMLMYATRRHQWSDLHGARRQFAGHARLEYDLAFRKDAAVTAVRDWSTMN